MSSRQNRVEQPIILLLAIVSPERRQLQRIVLTANCSEPFARKKDTEKETKTEQENRWSTEHISHRPTAVEKELLACLLLASLLAYMLAYLFVCLFV